MLDRSARRQVLRIRPPIRMRSAPHSVFCGVLWRRQSVSPGGICGGRSEKGGSRRVVPDGGLVADARYECEAEIRLWNRFLNEETKGSLTESWRSRGEQRHAI